MESVTIEQHEKWLEIKWGDGESSILPYIWLYDNQPGHFHPNGQKLVETINMKLDIIPHDVFVDEGRLFIEWEKDDLLIEYDVDWLKGFFTDNWNPPLNAWEVSDLENVQLRWDYEAVVSNEKALFDWLESAIAYGFAILENVPTASEKIFEVVAHFGYVRETNYGKCFDVVAKADPNNLAYTSDGLPPHTDNPYRDPVPTLQLLHCLKADAEGGESIMIDGYKIAEDLAQEDPISFEVLASQQVLFRFKDSETFLENYTTVIGLTEDNEIKHIRFNNRSIQPFEMDPITMYAYYNAYQTFEKYLHHEKYRYVFKLKPGDLVLFDNERMLHGRTAYNLNGERHLQGCYADRDSLFSKWRILSQKLF